MLNDHVYALMLNKTKFQKNSFLINFSQHHYVDSKNGSKSDFNSIFIDDKFNKYFKIQIIQVLDLGLLN